jgi:hypothetical protein
MLSPARLQIVAVLAGFVLLAATLSALLSQRPYASGGAGGNPLIERPDNADQLDLFDTLDAFNAGRLEHTAVNTTRALDRASLVLVDTREKSFPRRGTWISAERRTAFPFVELIPSYNATCPPGTGVRIHARVRLVDTGEWSPWLYFGRWGRTVDAQRDDRVVTEFAHGKVEIDVLTLRRPADAYQLRVSLQSFSPDPATTPSVRRVAAVYSGSVLDAERRRELTAPPAYVGRWDRALAVPFIPQGEAPAALVGDVCSPTSVTMVAAFAGVSRPLTDNALAIYDDEHRIFGNWNRAVQRAGELGLDAWVTRFRNWDQVRAQIAQGQPVIASIRFEKGVMPSNPIYQDTDGHLIVIRGFTPDGDVIVNDPASRQKGHGVVYKSAELGAAWFGAGGVAYIIRPSLSPSVSTSAGATTQPG